jgi:hypothetical protein
MRSHQLGMERDASIVEERSPTFRLRLLVDDAHHVRMLFRTLGMSAATKSTPAFWSQPLLSRSMRMHR